MLRYSLRGQVLSFVLLFVHVMHFISCHHVHCICIRVRLMHPNIFPVARFAIRRSHLLRRTPLVFFRERVSNVLGMDRGLSSGLSIPPVRFRSIWRSFGTPTVNRVTADAFCVLQKHTLSKQPKTYQTLFHALGRSITIVWAKTAPHLDSPSSLYLFICDPPEKRSQSKP